MSETGQETAEEFISIGRYDWYVSTAWNRLHYVDPSELTAEHRTDIEDSWAVFTPVRMACGRTARRLYIPGIFSRMSKPRCIRCCEATGMPQGKGSPKNDDACRVILGLAAEAGEKRQVNQAG